ncbi:MAG: ABC transporter substrate-binding protein [Armatimonadetes bacterium]|nr:ABC transporter substrate-binding protein [Armatimonadota bacterium]
MRHIWAIAFVLAALLLAGCNRSQPTDSNAPAPEAKNGTGASAPVTLTFWHTQTKENAQALDEMVQEFNRTNGKGITIKAEYQGKYSELYRKVMSAIQAKSLPDLAVAYESMVAEYMKADAVVPLDDYLARLPKESQGDIFPGYLETNRFPAFENKLLSFPFTKSVLVLYYNADMLKEAGFDSPPATWNQFKKAALACAKKDAKGQVKTYGLAVEKNASTIDGWFYSRGGELLNEDKTKVRFNEPECVEAYQLVADLVKVRAAYQTKDYDYQVDFGNRRVAMVFSSSTNRSYFAQAVNNRFKWGIAMIPQGDPDEPVTVQYGANIAVFKTTPEKEAAAWEFVRWFAARDRTARWSARSGYLPVRQSAAESPEMQAAWKKDPLGKTAFDLTRYARPEPNIRGWQDVRTILEDALESVISGKQTPKQALDRAAEAADKAIQEKM